MKTVEVLERKQPTRRSERLSRYSISFKSPEIADDLSEDEERELTVNVRAKTQSRQRQTIKRPQPKIVFKTVPKVALKCNLGSAQRLDNASKKGSTAGESAEAFEAVCSRDRIDIDRDDEEVPVAVSSLIGAENRYELRNSRGKMSGVQR